MSVTEHNELKTVTDKFEIKKPKKQTKKNKFTEPFN